MAEAAATVLTLGSAVETFNHSLAMLTAAYVGSLFVETVLPAQNDERPLIIEYLEGLMGMTGFVLLAVSLSEILAPFTYGYSEPLVFILFMPFLVGNALRKIRRTQGAIEAML